MYNDVTLRRVRATIVAVECVSVAHAPYYIDICGMSVCTIFFHIIP